MKKNFLLAIFAVVFMTWGCSDAKDKKLTEDDTEETGKKKKTSDDETDIESGAQSDPADVVRTIFKAAKSGDYSALSGLCSGDADGDAKDICDVADASEEKQDEFKSFFAKGKVIGDAEIEGNEAKVNVQLGDREETMNLMKKGKKWYLSGF